MTVPATRWQLSLAVAGLLASCVVVPRPAPAPPPAPVPSPMPAPQPTPDDRQEIPSPCPKPGIFAAIESITPRKCITYAQCVQLEGQSVRMLSSPADNCGPAAAFLVVRNCSPETVEIHTVRVGSQEISFRPGYGAMPTGGSRQIELHPPDGESTAIVSLTSPTGAVTHVETLVVIPPPEVTEEGPAECQPPT